MTVAVAVSGDAVAIVMVADADGVEAVEADWIPSRICLPLRN